LVELAIAVVIKLPEHDVTAIVVLGVLGDIDDPVTVGVLAPRDHTVAIVQLSPLPKIDLAVSVLVMFLQLYPSVLIVGMLQTLIGVAISIPVVLPEDFAATTIVANDPRLDSLPCASSKPRRPRNR
jgi:hypothetical protein